MERGVERILQGKKEEALFEHQQAADFRELMTMDPVSLINKKSLETQAQAMQKYQDYGTKLYQERGGNLSEMDKIDLLNYRKKIQADQLSMQSTEQRMMKDLQIAMNNPQRYSVPDMIDAYKNFLDTAQYDGTGLRPRPYTYAQYMDKISKSAKLGHKSTETEQIGPNRFSYTTSYDWTEEKGKLDYKRNVLSDPLMLGPVAEGFNKLSEEAKQAYFSASDANNDGVWDEDEKSNAILEYGWENDGYPQYMGKEKTERIYRPYRPTDSETKRRLETPAAIKQRVLSERKGIGTNKDMGFSVQSGIPTQYAKDTDEGIVFNYDDNVNKDWGISVNTDYVHGEDKDKFKGQETVVARPLYVVNGWIVWDGQGEDLKEIDEFAYYAGLRKKPSSFVERDGKFYEKVRSRNIRFRTMYRPVSGVLNSTFPYVSDLAEQEGLTTTPL
jgi:hypothetical protein